MNTLTSRVHAVFNSDIAGNWNAKDKKINKVVGCDNPMKREIDLYLNDGIALLEIGCGTGKLIEYVANKSKDSYIIGLDVSMRMIEAAKDRIDKLKDKNNKVNFMVGDIQNCGLRDEFFDIILLKQVLHHINDPALALKRIGRLLKPDGVIILMVPGPYYQREFFPHKAGSGKDILGRFSIEELEDKLLEGALFPVKLWGERFMFEFDNFYMYLNFMRDIGSLQKLYDYEQEKYSPVLKLMDWYGGIMSKTEKLQISGEYITAVCQRKEEWSRFYNKF